MSRGDEPNRQFVVQFGHNNIRLQGPKGIPYHLHDDRTNIFQIILYEGTNDIRVNYLDVTTLDQSWAKDETAAGIENIDGSAGLQYAPLSEPNKRYQDLYVHYSASGAYPGNQSPVADAGSNRTVAVGDQVTLDGSGSSDPDGDTLTYSWTQTGGTTVALSSSTTTRPTFTASEEGTFTFTLTVSDGKAQDTDTVVVTVSPTAAPVTSESGLYFPLVRTVDDWETEICLINPDDSLTLEGALQAYNDVGDEVESIDVTLPPNGRREFIVGDTFTADPDQISHIVFEATSEGDAAGYGKVYDGTRRLAIPAVGAADASNGDYLYVPHIASEDGWETRIGLLNTTSSRKRCFIQSDGLTIQTFYLEAGGYVTVVFGEEQAGLNSTVTGNDDLDSAVIMGGEGLIGVAEFERGSWLSGALLKDELATTLYFPHIPGTGGWVTGLVAQDPAGELSATVIPYDEEGNALGERQFDIFVEGQNKYVGLVSGSYLYESVADVIQEEPDLDLSSVPGVSGDAAWLEIRSASPITGLDLFSTTVDPEQYAGFSAVGMQSREGIFANVVDPDYTGIAFVNIEDGEATVELTAYSDEGAIIARLEEPITMADRSKRVDVASRLFPGSDISGASYIRYSSDRELVGFQMNVTPGGVMLDGLEVLKVDPVDVKVYIDSPDDGSTFDVDETIAFTGRGYDAEGDSISPDVTWIGMPMYPSSAFTWTSSIDGEIGLGGSLESELSEGVHTITLTATDPNTGEEGVARISITVGDPGCGSAE